MRKIKIKNIFLHQSQKAFPFLITFVAIINLTAKSTVFTSVNIILYTFYVAVTVSKYKSKCKKTKITLYVKNV